MKFAEILIILLILGVILSFSFLSNTADGYLHAYFLDVGQGDSIFVKTPDGKQILIDGGPNNMVIQKLGEVMPFYDRDIDVLVISHTDSDHITGLIEVLERYDFSLIIRSNILCEKTLCLALEEKISEEDAQVWFVDSGDVLDLGHGVSLNILYPFNDEPYNGKPNNNSVVVKLVYGDNTLLLTGDAEKKVETMLFYSEADISARFLKVAHHGSKTSTTGKFLEAVSPLFAFIEVGDNYYGHPSEDVLTRLENKGVTYYRTDRDGDVHLITWSQMDRPKSLVFTLPYACV
jgi:competence protein ComEC